MNSKSDSYIPCQVEIIILHNIVGVQITMGKTETDILVKCGSIPTSYSGIKDRMIK
jgi:hypothetical protein